MSAAPDLPIASPSRLTLASAMPGLFVVLWSTGFIGAKFGLPYAGPLTFLALRFALVTAAMVIVSFATGAAWPRSWRQAGHIAVVGVLIQGSYLGGVFIGLSEGVSAGLSALIVGLQPVLTAALVRRFLGERVTPRQWAGFALGLIGVALVVGSKLGLELRHLLGAGTTVAALIGITLGTLYQKRFCGEMDMRSGTAVQNGVATAMMLAGMPLFETPKIVWSVDFIFALAWLCLVLSVGATILLFWLLRRGAAARIASLFYLVPPTTALMAYVLFGETLGPAALLGMGIAVAGVALVVRGGAP